MHHGMVSGCNFFEMFFFLLFLTKKYYPIHLMDMLRAQQLLRYLVSSVYLGLKSPETEKFCFCEPFFSAAHVFWNINLSGPTDLRP